MKRIIFFLALCTIPFFLMYKRYAAADPKNLAENILKLADVKINGIVHGIFKSTMKTSIHAF